MKFTLAVAALLGHVSAAALERHHHHHQTLSQAQPCEGLCKVKAEQLSELEADYSQLQHKYNSLAHKASKFQHKFHAL